MIFEMLKEEQENSSLSLEVPSEDFVWVIGFGFCDLGLGRCVVEIEFTWAKACNSS